MTSGKLLPVGIYYSALFIHLLVTIELDTGDQWVTKKEELRLNVSGPEKMEGEAEGGRPYVLY